MINTDQEHALQATDVTFEWENLPSNKDGKGKLADIPSSEATLTGPFRVHDINMCIPRGGLVAIVGRVGSGKSSLLQGLIGEMRKSGGEFSFGGRVAYCPQSAWIQNASLVRPVQPSTLGPFSSQDEEG
jgi:ATP-binding cassette subfamily C (CFTR/MRP) protein 1